MRTAIDRLRFAIAFAEETNLDHFRHAWEWDKLRSELGTFLHGSPDEPMPHFGGLVVSEQLSPPFLHDYPEDKFRELQSDIRCLLRGIAPAQGDEVSGPPLFTTKQEWTALRLGGHVVLQAFAPVRDAVLFLLMLLLAVNGLQNVRRCPAKGCGRVFWKVRRQLYCSRTCVNRENMRAWTRKQRAETRAKNKRAHVGAQKARGK